jgi:four helix bundle protein
MNTSDKTPANFKDLLVWQQGMKIAQRTSALTGSFPTCERFGMVSQMRRAAVSIPLNLAEGQARCKTAQFVHCISISEGSLAELETQVRLSIVLGFCPAPAASDLFIQMEAQRKMRNAFRRRLTARL